LPFRCWRSSSDRELHKSSSLLRSFLKCLLLASGVAFPPPVLDSTFLVHYCFFLSLALGALPSPVASSSLYGIKIFPPLASIAEYPLLCAIITSYLRRPEFFHEAPVSGNLPTGLFSLRTQLRCYIIHIAGAANKLALFSVIVKPRRLCCHFPPSMPNPPHSPDSFCPFSAQSRTE